MPLLIAIDPGVHKCALAYFSGLEVFHVAMIPTGQKPALPEKPSRVVCEVPTVYATRGQRGRQSDIIALAYSAGVMVRAIDCADVRLVEPREWKGQVPKNVHHARVRATLTPEECLLFDTLDHNGKDAVALGLWELKRI